MDPAEDLKSSGDVTSDDPSGKPSLMPILRSRGFQLRAAALALLIPLLINLSGLIHIPQLSTLEHLGVTRMMGLGYRLDELLRGQSQLQGVLLLCGLSVGWTVSLRSSSAAPWTRVLSLPLCLIQGLALGSVALLGWALYPGVFALGGLLVILLGRESRRRKTGPEQTGSALLSTTAALITLVCLVSMASLLATHSEGTLWDQAADLIQSLNLSRATAWLAVAILVAAALGCCTWLASQGCPDVPDPARGPRLCTLGLVPWAVLGMTLVGGGLLVDIPDCSSVGLPGIQTVQDRPPAFALAANGNGILAVSQREARQVLLIDSRSGETLQTIPLGLGEPEDIVALPPPGDFIVAVVVNEQAGRSDLGKEPSERVYGRGLLHIDGVTLEGEVLEFPELCWASSMLWDEERGEVLLGCEGHPSIFPYRPADRSLGAPLKGIGFGDGEDLTLDRRRNRILTVPLMHSRRIAALDRDTLVEQVSAVIGGGNYSVAIDAATDRVFVSRFYDGVIRILRAEDLGGQGSIRTGFSVRPLRLFARQRILAAASMFHSDLLLIDLDSLEVRERLRLGGRVKGLAASADGSKLYLSSTCGIIQVEINNAQRTR